MARARGPAIAGAVSLWLAACGGGASHGATPAGGHGSAGGTMGAVSSPSPTTADAGGTDATSTASASADAGGAGFIMPTGPQAAQAAQIYGEGAAAYGRGDFPTAARSFQRAYELFPAPAMAYNLARVYERMGEVDQATHFFEIVQHANPPPSPEQAADIEHRLVGLRAYAQRRRDGIAQPPPSTDALTQEGNTWLQRGVQLFRSHRYTNALMAFEQAHAYLQTPELYYNLAVTHRALHHVDMALEFMREYLSARRGTAEEAWIESQIHELEAQR